MIFSKTKLPGLTSGRNSIMKTHVIFIERAEVMVGSSRVAAMWSSALKARSRASSVPWRREIAGHHLSPFGRLRELV